MKQVWRLRPIAVLAFVALTILGLFWVDAAAAEFLRSRLAPLMDATQLNGVLNEFRTAFIIFAALTLLLSIAIAITVSTAATRSLARLRTDAGNRLKGLRSSWRPPITELQSVSTAIDRLATELEQRGEHWQRERDELALLINSATEGILLLDADRRILRANAGGRVLLGLPDDCVGRPLPTLVRGAELRGLLDRLGTDGTQTAEVTVDDRRLLVAGHPIAQDEPISNMGEAAPRATLTLVDLTELRRLEGVRRDFVANVSHEIRTPLTSIRGYVETLMSDDLEPGMRKQFLEVIHKNAERLRRIVDDLLDLSRLESGTWRPDVEDIGVGGLIDDVWETCAQRAREKSILFVGPEKNLNARADASALRHILLNLFDNALRYTPPGGTIRVLLRTETGRPSSNGASGPHAGRPFVTIEVQDNGTGIPGDALPRIFERFYRVDPARSRADGGTGLGLSIVKHMVESMEGEVSASSELGKGTTIRVRLPAAQPAS